MSIDGIGGAGNPPHIHLVETQDQKDLDNDLRHLRHAIIDLLDQGSEQRPGTLKRYNAAINKVIDQINKMVKSKSPFTEFGVGNQLNQTIYGNKDGCLGLCENLLKDAKPSQANDPTAPYSFNKIVETDPPSKINVDRLREGLGSLNAI